MKLLSTDSSDYADKSSDEFENNPCESAKSVDAFNIKADCTFAIEI